MTELAIIPDRRPYEWIRTFTGRKIYLTDPQPGDISIEDIGHALANQCRYAGHTRIFYSVAEHSVLCSHHFLDPTDALWGLLHDASEAYLGDVSSPLKGLLPEYQRIEKQWMEVIVHALGLPPAPPAGLKDVDTAVLLAEAEKLMRSGADGSVMGEWATVPPAKVTIQCWDPFRAEEEFLTRWRDLT